MPQRIAFLCVTLLSLLVALAACGGQSAKDSSATPASPAQPIRVAVAANFASTLRELAAQYSRETGQRLEISAGATGALHAQIVQGAPFDIFFAADAQRPAMLEEDGRAVSGSRRTYARGTLALWSAKPDFITDMAILSTDAYQHLAIANPNTAPYGLAAQQAMEKLGLWEMVQPRLVQGQSSGQTHQFVSSGAAELGFVALSQIQQPGLEQVGSHLVVSPDLYDPIEQQVVMLTESKSVRSFLDWMSHNEIAQAVILSHGYQLDNRDLHP